MQKKHWWGVGGFVAGTFLGGWVMGLFSKILGKA